ncbi:hypothetical protein PM082_024731 [Marasmius tenuissimus]|nr:hypothetical protein PM082_024731 [Marasmius tenuissimus]
MTSEVPSDIQDNVPELIQSQASTIQSLDGSDIRSLLATPPPDSEPENAADRTEVDSDFDDLAVDGYVSAVGKAIFEISQERLEKGERALMYYSGTHVQVIVSSNNITSKGGPLDGATYGTVDRLWERCRDAMCPWYPNLSAYETVDDTGNEAGDEAGDGAGDEAGGNEAGDGKRDN